MANPFVWGQSTWDGGDVWGGAGRAQYLLQADVERDGTYGHAEANLSGYTGAVIADHGMADSFETVAPPAELRATLNNADGDFLPERTTATYYGLLVPGPLVRLLATYNAQSYTLWTGRLASLDVYAGAWQVPRVAYLLATDPMPALLNAEYRAALAQSVTVDAALTTMFEADVAPWPYEDNPAAVNTYTAFEAGRTVLAWVGDNAEQDDQNIVRAQVFVRDILPAEGDGARFFWDAKAAAWTFHNREHDIDESVAVTLTGDDIIPEESEYRFGDRLTNKIAFDFVPRKVGQAGSVIYEYPSLPFDIGKRATSVIEFVARYADPDVPDARIGAVDPITPVPNTDYRCTDELPPHPKGEWDRTDRPTVTVTFFADRANVKLEYYQSNTIYFREFQLRGTPLYTFDRMTVTERDDDSIDTYGLHEQTATLLPNVDDEAFARALAQWAIVQYAEPFGRFTYVTFEATQSDALMTQALTRNVGDRIRLDVDHLNHERDYAIVGVRHIIDAASGEHRCRWTLKPLPLLDFLILDDDTYGLLDGDNYLAL